MNRLVCIVEGHGEVEAVPVLVRRIIDTACPGRYVDVPRPLRVPRQKFVKDGEFQRHVELAVRKAGENGAVLVLLDADDDCPAELGTELMRRAIDHNPSGTYRVVLAKAEFEAWFLAAAGSLRGKRGLPENVEQCDDPEAVRNAKGWITDRMEGTRAYSETLDQPALAAMMGLDEAMASPSFAKFRRDVLSLL